MSRPRVLFVGRGRFRFPLGRTLERRFEALSAELDWRQLGTSLDGKQSPDSRLVLARPSAIGVLDGPLYYLRLPRRIARELRGFQPDAVIAQGAQETALALTARRLARSKTAVILDLHGDWRAPTRLYGSRARRLLAPFADSLARRALRRADGVQDDQRVHDRARPSGGHRAHGRVPGVHGPRALHGAPGRAASATLRGRSSSVCSSGTRPSTCLPMRGAAWPRQCRARLCTSWVRARSLLLAKRLVDELPARVEWTPSLTTEGVAAALDASTLLVLPSRSEGMGRVVIEAACRGRAVVGSRVGGIPDVVSDGETGLLVPPDDAGALAEALIRVLADRALAERLGSAGHRAVAPWLVTPQEYARRLRNLVEKVVAAS